MSVWRAIRLLLIVLALGSSVWLGIVEGLNSLHGAMNAGQRVTSYCQILYGVAALAGLVGLLIRSAWAQPAVACWGLLLMATATLAPVVWGGTDWLTAVVSGIVTLLIAGLAYWGTAAHSKPKPAAE